MKKYDMKAFATFKNLLSIAFLCIASGLCMIIISIAVFYKSIDAHHSPTIIGIVTNFAALVTGIMITIFGICSLVFAAKKFYTKE